MRRRAVWILLLAPVCAGAVMALPGRSLASDLPQVEGIEIRGTEAVSAGRLRSLLRTRSPSFWRPFRSSPYRVDILRRDLERIESFYHDQGYLAARAVLDSVETRDDGKTVRITISVTEGEPTRVGSIEFPGLRYLDRARVLAAIESHPGERYSPDRVTLDRQRIYELYADVGRPFSVVRDSVSVTGQVAALEFRIRAAPLTRVGDILIVGTRSTKHYVIKRELTFDTGDLLERRQVLRSRERLLQTGFFRDVRFEPLTRDSTLAPRLVELRLLVAERRMGWVEAGVGYNSSKQLRLGGEIGHRNILGNAHRLVADSRFDFDLDALISGDRPAIDESRVGLSFREPWLFSTRTIGTISIFTELTREPERTTAGVQEETIQGIALSADRGLTAPLRMRATLENRWITQKVVEEIGDEGGLTALRDQHFITRSLSLFAERDHRDSPFDPSVGNLQTWLVEVAGGALGGTANYLKFSLGASWYRRLPGGMVVAGRLRGGWIHPFGDHDPGTTPLERVPREARFRAGGATTVRGYPEDSLGPQSVAAGQQEPLTDRGLVTVITNLELRFPLFWRLSGAVFGDGGNVWEEARDLDIGDFWPDDPGASLEDYRYSVGGGLRLRTPLGPLRLDYGYGLVRGDPERLIRATQGGEWHFSLGQAF